MTDEQNQDACVSESSKSIAALKKMIEISTSNRDGHDEIISELESELDMITRAEAKKPSIVALLDRQKKSKENEDASLEDLGKLLADAQQHADDDAAAHGQDDEQDQPAASNGKIPPRKGLGGGGGAGMASTNDIGSQMPAGRR